MKALYAGPRGVCQPGKVIELPETEADSVVAAGYGEAVKAGTAVGPTLEEFLKAGYKAEHYPPAGFAERPSPALTKLRAAQKKKADEDAAAEAKKKADEDAAAEAKKKADEEKAASDKPEKKEDAEKAEAPKPPETAAKK